VRSSRNAKKREPSSNVTCFICGVVQTFQSFKRHFPQCLGSSNLRTSVSNDTLVPPINTDELDCDPMVNDLSKLDFVCRHLSVESQNLLACYDYDYDDDDDSDQSSVDKFTMDDPDTGSESGVNNFITDENMPGVVPPFISVPLNDPASLDDLAYQPESTNDFAGNPNDAPLGSTEVSIELEVAEKYSHKLFTHQEQSMTKLLLLFSSTGCCLSLFDEVLSHIKKDFARPRRRLHGP
jgi:hypothetical protein